MTRLPDADGSRAVLIGVHRYDALDDLPAVEQNLTGLRDVFIDPALWGLAERNCLLVRQPALRSPEPVASIGGSRGRGRNRPAPPRQVVGVHCQRCPCVIE